MAQETKKDKPKKTLKEAASATYGSAEDTFALEYEEDRKTMRWAVVGAVIIHIIIFLIQVPEIIAEAGEIKKKFEEQGATVEIK